MPSTSTALTAARARNRAMYGNPDEAREYADDMGDVYCELCHGIYHAQPGLPNDGHDCPAISAGL